MKQKVTNIFFLFFILLLILLLFLLQQAYTGHSNPVSSSETALNITCSPLSISTFSPTCPPTQTTEDDSIFSYSQGPKAWEAKKVWSGSWAEETLDGNKFGSFGCGLCCLANIYSSLSGHVCSPIDMYHHAKEVSNYSPSYGYGAIDWNAMQSTILSCGFSTTLEKKPLKYNKFKHTMETIPCAVVLVSSYYNDNFWKDTPGHYVTIWNYSSEDDTVFLSDSGDPARNRQRIPLRYVYDALKESSSYQLLCIQSYSEEENQWGWDEITEEWIAP